MRKLPAFKTNVFRLRCTTHPPIPRESRNFCCPVALKFAFLQIVVNGYHAGIMIRTILPGKLLLALPLPLSCSAP